MSVKLTWNCYNTDVSFMVYRDISAMNIKSPPMPIVYGVKAFEYLDESANEEYYYMVGAVLDGRLYLSEQVKAIKVIPGHFVVDVNFAYIPPSGSSVSFTVKT